jgi:endo-1,4-beta-xylanase
MQRTLEDFSKLGLKIQITELDISVYGSIPMREKSVQTSLIFTAEKAKQIEIYKTCLNCLEYQKYFSNNILNISDRHSWLDNFPLEAGRIILFYLIGIKPQKVFWKS